MSKINDCLAAAALVLCAFVALAHAESGEGPWQTDFEAAKAKAKAEKKLLLVDFTGSDWCSWCMKLHKEVFSKEAFTSEAPKQFVLVVLDYPARKKLADDLKAQNEKLRKQYKIRGYPTVLLLDADGNVMAHTGYQPGGPEKYVKQLSELLDVYASMVKMKGDLEKTEGLDRAKLLDQLVDASEKLDNDETESLAWSKEIVSLDAGNKAGLKVKHEFRLLMAQSKTLLEGHKIAESDEAIQKALALPGITTEQKQTAYMAETRLEFTKQDFAAVIKCLEQVVELDAHNPAGTEATENIKRFKLILEAQETVKNVKGELEHSAGLERAKLLDKLLEAQAKIPIFTKESLKDTEKWTKEILALDADNKAGLKTKYELRAKLAAANMQIQTGKIDKARAALDEAAALPGLSDAQKKNIEQVRKQLPKESASTEK